MKDFFKNLIKADNMDTYGVTFTDGGYIQVFANNGRNATRIAQEMYPEKKVKSAKKVDLTR